MGVLEVVIRGTSICRDLPCLIALEFVLLSVVLLRTVSGADSTWRHIGNIYGIVFLSVQHGVNHADNKKLVNYLPGFPGF